MLLFFKYDAILDVEHEEKRLVETTERLLFMGVFNIFLFE